MSSHHFVKELQEPALIIYDLADLSTDTLHALLEWSPVVICSEFSISSYTGLGHKLDVALVPEAALGFWMEELAEQNPIRVHPLLQTPFIESAMKMMESNGQKTVNIVISDAQKAEVLPQLMCWIGQMEMVLFAGNERHLFIKDTYQKWIPAGTSLRVMPLYSDSSFEISGFDGEAKSDVLVKTTDGQIKISGSQPFLIIEEM